MHKKKLIILVLALIIIGKFTYKGIAYFLITTFRNTTDTLINSESKSEAKARGTFICSIKPISPIYNSIYDFKFETSDGWVERTWYGHTGGPTNIDSGFTLNLCPVGKGNRINDLIYVNAADKSDLMFIDDKYFALIPRLPEMDSIKFYFLKENKNTYNAHKFEMNHVIDSFYIVLDKDRSH